MTDDDRRLCVNSIGDDFWDRWDRKELGASSEHAVQASEQNQKDLDEALGLQTLTIRLSKRTVDKIDKIAKAKGIWRVPLIREILNDYVKNNLG